MCRDKFIGNSRYPDESFQAWGSPYIRKYSHLLMRDLHSVLFDASRTKKAPEENKLLNHLSSAIFDVGAEGAPCSPVKAFTWRLTVAKALVPCNEAISVCIKRECAVPSAAARMHSRNRDYRLKPQQRQPTFLEALRDTMDLHTLHLAIKTSYKEFTVRVHSSCQT